MILRDCRVRLDKLTEAWRKCTQGELDNFLTVSETVYWAAHIQHMETVVRSWLSGETIHHVDLQKSNELWDILKRMGKT